MSHMTSMLSLEASQPWLNLELIPQPSQAQACHGTFTLDSKAIITSDANADDVALYLSEVLQPATGSRLRIAANTQPCRNNTIVMRILPGLSGMGEEGYELSIQPETIQIQAYRPAGLFYACQTLRQFLPKETLGGAGVPQRAWPVPCGIIRDKPRFPWRGLMLDVARHFLSKDFILRCIDHMALYKMNRLHLHLTDSTAWTLEIKKYPHLTNLRTRICAPGLARGTYSQQDMRDIVNHAAARHVMVVPEFEMPSHSRAAVNAYPELMCAHLPRVTNAQHDYEEYCAGRDGVYDFIENVMSEMVEVFDAPFIHIGGDEYRGESWVDCPDCRRRIKMENLEAEDTPELQELFRHCQGSPTKYLLYRYMMRRVARMVVAKGRTPIVWDDLSWQGKFPGRSVVMQWHYQGCNDWVQNRRILENPATEAARAGHDVIAAPASHLYFDYCDGGALLQRLYDFEPVPHDLTPQQAPYVLGPHACLWATPQDKIDEMLFPRLLVLAEQGWTSMQMRHWDDFAPRLQKHYHRLDVLGVQYTRPPKTEGLVQGALMREWDIPKLTSCRKEWLINDVVTGNGCLELTLRLLSGKETTTIEVSWVDDGCSPIALSESRLPDDASSGEHIYRITVSEFLPQASYYVRVVLKGDGQSACRGDIVLRRVRITSLRPQKELG